MMRKWGELERDYLARGIEKYGIGEWDKIVKEFLPQWVSPNRHNIICIYNLTIRIEGSYRTARQNTEVIRSTKFSRIHRRKMEGNII